MSKVEAEFYAEAIGAVADGFLIAGIAFMAVIVVGAIYAFLSGR